MNDTLILDTTGKRRNEIVVQDLNGLEQLPGTSLSITLREGEDGLPVVLEVGCNDPKDERFPQPVQLEFYGCISPADIPSFPIRTGYLTDKNGPGPVKMLFVILAAIVAKEGTLTATYVEYGDEQEPQIIFTFSLESYVSEATCSVDDLKPYFSVLEDWPSDEV